MKCWQIAKTGSIKTYGYAFVDNNILESDIYKIVCKIARKANKEITKKTKMTIFRCDVLDGLSYHFKLKKGNFVSLKKISNINKLIQFRVAKIRKDGSYYFSADSLDG